MANWQRPFWLCVAAVISPLAIGCALFTPQADLASSLRDTRKPLLPPIAASREAIQLEVIFVERPAGDPLLGDELWKEVDQVGSTNPELHAQLNLNGLRAGHVSSTPPQALQTLMGMATEIGDDESKKQLVGRRLVLRSGAETEIQAGIPSDEFELEYHQGNQVIRKDYQKARCIFRVKPVRLQDGWVRLEFVPEVHHGDHRLRHTPTEGGWEMRNTQKVDSRIAEKFTMILNAGEIAVLSAEPHRPATLGERFFLTEEEDSAPRQRLLIIRLCEMPRTTKAYEANQ